MGQAPSTAVNAARSLHPRDLSGAVQGASVQAREIIPEVPEVKVFSRATHDGPLPHAKANGESKLGKLDAPRLKPFLTNNPTPNGKPWNKRDKHTNYYKDYPNTGVIREYDWTITREVIAPDGYERDVLLINGAFPGPMIEANWGDTIQVTIRNNIENKPEGTSLHMHGFHQKDRPWEDGTPGVSQCPIPPGSSFTYSFMAEQYGTTWYHSHYGSQYGGGVSGAVVIHGPETEEYDIDLGPVMITDWYHIDYHSLIKIFMTPGFTPYYVDTTLINGKGQFDCSSLPENNTNACNQVEMSKFRFEKGKKHLLRIINHGGEGVQRFSIDSHMMKVIAFDLIPIEPFETKVLTLGSGQRADVVVEANADGNAFNMRADMVELCGNYSKTTNAYILYDDTPEDTVPKSLRWDVVDDGTCTNDPLDVTVPILKMPVPEPDVTLNINSTLFLNDTGHLLYTLDNTTMRTNWNSPTLLLAALNNHTWENNWNMRNLGDAKSVRINFYNANVAPHPMHMHGFNMYVLHEGPGEWDGETIVRAENPMRRDTAEVRAYGHLVVQFDAAENPGVWPFHCHTAVHAAWGMAMQFLTAPEKVAEMKIPQTITETCRAWADWTNTNIPDQIDSGM